MSPLSHSAYQYQPALDLPPPPLFLLRSTVVKVQAKRALGVAEKSKQDNAELYATFESLLSTMPK